MQSVNYEDASDGDADNQDVQDDGNDKNFIITDCDHDTRISDRSQRIEQHRGFPVTGVDTPSVTPSQVDK